MTIQRDGIGNNCYLISDLQPKFYLNNCQLEHDFTSAERARPELGILIAFGWEL